MPSGFPYESAPNLMRRETVRSYMQVDALSAKT